MENDIALGIQRPENAPRRRGIQGIFNIRMLMLLVMAVSVIALGGCRTAPIRDLDTRPIPPGATLTQISKAIQGAGNSLGWAMQETAPGMIVGTIFLRDHMAKVEIPFSTSSYSIRYSASTNLKYNEEKRTIHSNYNGWISNLDNQIRANLSML
ncbi:hypothetical protein [Thiocapsa sp.]|uniref:hypothetical protein n=1 Tax=Thiocapsa sp. TaxID=2024551 RepID=UPI0035948F76